MAITLDFSTASPRISYIHESKTDFDHSFDPIVPPPLLSEVKEVNDSPYMNI
jgi:hypothetical protein